MAHFQRLVRIAKPKSSSSSSINPSTFFSLKSLKSEGEAGRSTMHAVGTRGPTFLSFSYLLGWAFGVVLVVNYGDALKNKNENKHKDKADD